MSECQCWIKISLSPKLFNNLPLKHIGYTNYFETVNNNTKFDLLQVSTVTYLDMLSLTNSAIPPERYRERFCL